MKRALITVLCLSHLVVLSLGILAGVARAFWSDGKAHLQTAGGAPSLQLLYPHYVQAQRERGGYEQYRDALLDLLPTSELGREHILISVIFEGKTEHIRRMINYARLSRLESELGTPAEAKRFLALAVAECNMHGTVDCTSETPFEYLELWEEFQRKKAGNE